MPIVLLTCKSHAPTLLVNGAALPEGGDGTCVHQINAFMSRAIEITNVYFTLYTAPEGTNPIDAHQVPLHFIRIGTRGEPRLRTT